SSVWSWRAVLYYAEDARKRAPHTNARVIVLGVRAQHPAALGGGKVEMGVAAIDEDVLAGDVGGLRRNEEKDHGGDFVGLGHAFAERDFGNDAIKLFFRVGELVDPPFVERRENFGGNQGVDANAAREQFGSPIASERENCAFRGRVAG